MFPTEAKNRQPPSPPKSAIHSNKLLNNGQQPPVQASKIKNVEIGFTISAQVNKPDQSNAKVTGLGNSKANASYKTTITKSEIKKPPMIRKSYIPKTSVNKTLPVSRVLLTSQASLNNRKIICTNQMPLQEAVKNQPVQEIEDMAIQTNESEILNHSLIVGDLKTVIASKSVTEEIDKLRRDNEIKKLLMATRKFEQHSQRDEQHLDELNEFLDKSFITRRPHKLRDNNLEEDRKVIACMDELLQRKRPKTESITDIRSRIKLKEQELLSLFNRFQKKREHF